MSLEPDLETNAAFSVEKQGGSVLFRLAASSRNHLVIDLARKQRHRFSPISAKDAEMGRAPRQHFVAGSIGKMQQVSSRCAGFASQPVSATSSSAVSTEFCRWAGLSILPA